MPSLEDNPHTALADLIENHVVAEDESLGLALQDAFCLVLGQFPRSEQLSRERLGILGPLIQKRLEFFGRHQTAAQQQSGESLQVHHLGAPPLPFGRDGFQFLAQPGAQRFLDSRQIGGNLWLSAGLPGGLKTVADRVDLAEFGSGQLRLFGVVALCHGVLSRYPRRRAW